MSRSSLATALFLLFANLSQQAFAARVLDEGSIDIDGEPRRYYHLHDEGAPADSPVIVLIDGSGCGKFGPRLPGFFDQYEGSLHVYFLEKPHVAPDAGAQPQHCPDAFERADRRERRVADIVQFIDREPRLKAAGARSLGLLGFSEGGAVAPQVAAKSRTVGRLAVIGAGGMRQSDEFLLFAARGVQPYAQLAANRPLADTFADIGAHPAALDKHFFGHPYAYWSSHLFQDPLPTYAQLEIPIVAAMGEQDESVPIESGRRLQGFFAARPQADFRFFEFLGANHGLAAPDKPSLKPFIARLVRWFKGEPDAFAGLAPRQP
ncbi:MULTISPECIES: S9 family peptidase [unclassified Massilia]|uniref:alpha/beta hydrolase family protein n=1 Tax=unclassified Massilia TaxID=2609279 RepID=UPI00177FD263|nr:MULTISPECIES: dienelactone hydrolase family protein [unclassified Massilia]MBD8529257.1 dienelactone hydrolase family protein [Massilia sp. CFBP 13647]MBD8672651.1 dienelactone hydrolase family protein [Massilia sp. CFBP 13721]